MSDLEMVTFGEGSGYRIYYNIYDGNVYGHVDLQETKLSTIKEAKRTWLDMKKHLRTLGFTEMYGYNPGYNIQKFDSDHEHIGTTESVYGVKYDVYEWSLV